MKIKGVKLAELQDVFHVIHGNKFDMNKMEACAPSSDAIAFVGRSGEDNGIVNFVRFYQAQTPFAAGLITVALGGAALSSFVQFRPFYTAQNIDILKPREPMTLDVKLFYCLCIEANRFRYSTFGREANRTLKRLELPSRDSIPDWIDGISKLAAKELTEDLFAATNTK